MSHDDEDHLDTEGLDEPAAGEEISYQTFGEHFIRYLVTVPRLRGEIEDALQATVEGSADALPNDLLVASYRFAPNEMEIEQRVSEEAEVGFTLHLGGWAFVELRADCEAQAAAPGREDAGVFKPSNERPRRSGTGGLKPS